MAGYCDKYKHRSKLYLIITFIVFIFYYYLCFNRNYYRKTIKAKPSMKYILQWTSANTIPFQNMSIGQNVFVQSNCPSNNCYITSARNFLNKITDFHAILFYGPELCIKSTLLPIIRSSNQTYIFVSIESSHYYSIFDEVYDDFFNLTWTYKLNSDLYFGYMIIRNKEGQVIGPKQHMHWLTNKDMRPIDDVIKKELRTKSKVAAWFVSNCYTLSKREIYVLKMINQLALYNMTVDIYGKCGSQKYLISKDRDLCNKLLKKFYYFYLSFENSFSEDYVTEKLLTALHNNAIPVVYGAANYTRFLPEGAYLDAGKLKPKELVNKMVNIMTDTEEYYTYFKWRNHYSYHRVEDSAETNYYCDLCNRLNMNSSGGSVKEFRQWWNPYIDEHNIDIIDE